MLKLNGTMTMMSGERAVERCDVLGRAPYSDMEGGLFRAFLTPAYGAAQKAVMGWMREAGMSTRIDAAGNLVGRYEGTCDNPPLIIGSHLDSVRDAGRYDGPLGVLLGIECVAALRRSGRRLRFPIEVYAFGDEEGSRFPLAMLTSRAVAGVLEADMDEPKDTNGIGLFEALASHGDAVGAELARDFTEFRTARHPGALAYLEAHIEQGPMLESEGLAVGNVTGIAAQKRFSASVSGKAGHAGTTPMKLRSDALAATSAMILAAEQVARTAGGDRVATVGSIEVGPGAANVIPGSTRFTLDIRSSTDGDCAGLADAILFRLHEIAGARGVTLDVEALHSLPASPCDPHLMDLMDSAIEGEGLPVRRLVSGAGHDAMILSALCPTAMLFIRCREGVSHNPAEHVYADDAELAARVMLRFIEMLEDVHRA